MRRSARLALVTAVAGASACAPSAAPASAAALAFHHAVAERDGATACALLAPLTRADVASDQPCAAAVLEQQVPVARTVLGSVRFGDQVQVRLDGDVVFLGRYPDGWLVRAAACTPRGPDLPYDCTVSGG